MFNMTHRNRYLYPLEALAQVIDVTAAPYYAVGNDTDDDNTKIHDAIAAASSLTAPKIVYFPQGTWKLNTTLVCQGVDIWAAPGAVFRPGVMDMEMVRMKKTSTWQGGFFNTFYNTFTGSCFVVDGSDIDGGFSAFNARSPRIDNVDLLSYGSTTGQGKAFHLRSLGGGGSDYNQVTMGRISNIRLRNFNYGMLFDVTGNGYANGWFVNNVHCFGCYYAIYLVSTGTYSVGGNKFLNIGFQPTATPATQHCLYLDNASVVSHK